MRRRLYFTDGDLSHGSSMCRLNFQADTGCPDNDSLSRSAHLTEQTVLLNQFETRVSLQPQNFSDLN